MIDESTKVLMLNWAAWRLSREQPGLSMSNAYSLVQSRGGSGGSCAIVLLNDEAFEVEQAIGAMADYLRQALIEYWLRSEPAPKKASRCRCSLATYWRRLERGHEWVHTFRRALQDRQHHARAAWRARSLQSISESG